MALRGVRERKAGKDYTCSRCGDTIHKGAQYRYWEMGFRPSYKRIRCMKTTCYPRNSERETSNVSEVYAAQEEAEDTLGGILEAGPQWGDWDTTVGEVREAVTTAGEAIGEVAQTYRDADEAFGGQGATEHAERADTLEAAADELQSYDPSDTEPDACDEHDEPNEECTDCETNVNGWLDSLVSDARDAVTGVELP